MTKTRMSFQTANSKFGFLGTVFVQKFEKGTLKLREIISSSLVFCVIDKSFSKHLMEGAKLIRTKFQEANSKDVGVIDIFQL